VMQFLKYRIAVWQWILISIFSGIASDYLIGFMEGFNK